MSATYQRVNFLLLLGLAWAVTAGVLFADRWADMGVRLFDTDDAMRLVEVREFLAGRGWFDLHEARIDPPVGYDTHWSRLLDAGMAGLVLLFRLFVNATLAETLMRAVWPLLWLLFAMAATAALAWRIAGRTAAIVALVIAACAIPAFQHFKPGRIDHHNVQITLALAVAAAAAWSDRARYAAALAGALTGLALAVGLENVLFIALAGAAITLHFAVDGREETSARPLADYGLAVAASVLIAFLLEVPSGHWRRPACDAIAVNWLIPATIAGLGIAGVARLLTGANMAGRTAGVVVVGGLAFAAFVAIEPRCLGGPFALADATVKAVWLDRVDETEPLVSVMRGFPIMGAWLCAFPLVALLAALALARDADMRRDLGFLLATAALVLSVGETFAAVKVYAYGMWLGMPLVAALACRAAKTSGLRAGAARLAAALILTPTAITAGAITIAQAAAGADPAYPGFPERSDCSRNDAYALMARLPAGLVATDINYGPFVLALTPHSVIAAPYHRMTGGIVAAHTILNTTTDEARRIIAAYGVRYVALCGARAPTGADNVPGSLRAELVAGHAPPWLDAIPQTPGALFAIYRVR